VSKAGTPVEREPRGIDFATVAVERLLKSGDAEEHEKDRARGNGVPGLR
jgi:hypothetical protein